MIFIFRAAFWTLIVYAFLPAGFYAPQDGAFARHAGEIASSTLNEASERPVNTAALCEGRETLCETVGEFGRFAGWAATMAADRAESAFDDFAQSRTPSQHDPRAEARAASRSADEVFAAAAGEPAAR
ncbi:MAG: hypothetical protein NXI12_00350 [Alphaproteobacteria bacterium]|nr:hypothetical protein [Alphaproteobacteria bacterium]